MKAATARPMLFNVRPIEDDRLGPRWHWMIYEPPPGCFVRHGRVAGDRAKAERAARAAIAFAGGQPVDDEGG